VDGAHGVRVLVRAVILVHASGGERNSLRNLAEALALLFMNLVVAITYVALLIVCIAGVLGLPAVGVVQMGSNSLPV